MAKACVPPFPRSEALAKVASAIERTGQQATAEDIRSWISIATGSFSVGDVARDLGVKNTGNIRQVLMRMKAKGIIESYGGKDGTYRLAAPAPKLQDLVKASEGDEFVVRWPLKVEELVMLTRGSLAVVAGETNSGKTAFMINFCDLNLDRHPIRYLSTETNAARFMDRVKNLSRPRNDWSKIQFTDEVKTDFHLHVLPEAITIIDYMEPDVEMLWRLGLSIQKVFEAVTTGLAIVCIQKKKGSDYGYGGTFTAFKSELYLAIAAQEGNRGELKIIKGKNWRSPRCNPNFMKRSFYIEYGIQFHPDLKRPDWYTGTGDKEADY
jgi:hypothetical protein